MWHMPKAVYGHNACFLWWGLLAAPLWRGVVFSWLGSGSQNPPKAGERCQQEAVLSECVQEMVECRFSHGCSQSETVYHSWLMQQMPPCCRFKIFGIKINVWCIACSLRLKTWVPASVVLWVPLLPIKSMTRAYIWNFNQICTTVRFYIYLLSVF